MQRALLAGAVLLASCKKDPKECAALLDKTDARIAADLRHSAASMTIDNLVDRDKRDLPRVAAAAWPFEPGLPLHIDPADGARDETHFEQAVRTEACVHKTAPVRLYLLAGLDTPAALLADRVAWLDAAAATWKVPIETLLAVRLPAEIRYDDWPEGTSSDVKAFGKELLDHKDDKTIARLQERIRMASAGCSDELKKRIEEASDQAVQSNAIHFAMTKGLRDCGCSGVDAPTVIGLYHIFDIMSSDLGWVRLSSQTGTPLPAGATVGALVTDAKADAKTTLRVPAGNAPTIEPLACEGTPGKVLTRISEDWQTAPGDDAARVVTDLFGQLDACMQKFPLEHSAIVELMLVAGGTIHPPGEADASAQVVDRTLDAYDLEGCMRMRIDLGNADGVGKLDFYVPGKR